MCLWMMANPIRKILWFSRLEQDPPRNAQGNIYDYVAEEGVGHLTDLLKRNNHHISVQLEENYSDQNFKSIRNKFRLIRTR